MKLQVWVALLAAAVIAAGSLQLTRPGYSVDEEFTVFAVRGIQAHGLPILPSGLLYDRGIAYSYAAWLAGAVTGSELPAFRAISLISAALSTLLVFILVRRVANDVAAIGAAALVATSVPFWATATSGRFYAPFLLVYLAFLICLTHRTYWIPLFVAGLSARLTHELGFTLAAIPLACVLVATGDRRHWLKATAITIAGLAAGQLALLALHYAAPSSGDMMVRRFFLWQVLNLFEQPGDQQFGIPIIALVIGLIVAPKRAWPIAVIAVSLATMILAFSAARATNTAPLSWELVQSVLVEGSRYPLDMFWHLVVTMSPVVGFTTAMLLTRAFRTEEWPPRHRAAHGLWIGWVLWFGLIESGITTNYLLLPVTSMLMAFAIDMSVMPIGIEGEPRPKVVTPWHNLVALAFFVFAFSWSAWEQTPLDAARPTIRVEGIDEIRAGLQPSDRIACTDELGCLMLVGRIDRWLALDDYVRERFLVQRADGPPTGVYTGVLAAFRPGDLFTPNADGTLPDRVVIVDVFKEYPIGNSRFWLPKAIEEDGLQVTPLLETPQIRVLQVSPQERVARRLRPEALAKGRQP